MNNQSSLVSDFSEIQDQWIDLLPQTTINTVFFTPQFQQVWWKNFGKGECHIIRVDNDAKELIGVAPFFIHNGTLSFFGNHELSDYLDFIIQSGSEMECYAAITDKLRELSWASISLFSVPEKSLALSQFSELIKKEGWQIEIHQQDICPVISLPQTWEEYLQKIGKKQRHEIKRKWKNVEEHLHPQFSVVSSAENIDQAAHDFIHLHKLSSAEKAAFWTPEQTAYFRDIIQVAAENNWLKLFFLEVEGKRAATMLCFDYNNQFYLYNSGYDPVQFAGMSIGNVLTSHTIKTAIELGRSRYDFLRGDEEYKLRYGAVAEPIFDVTISR